MTKKNVENIADIIAGIETGNFRQASIGKYEFSVTKPNKEIEVSVCRTGKNYEDTGFASRKFQKNVKWSEVYNSINDMMTEAKYDGVTVTSTGW
ncbi:hypothetical protein COS83_00760 [archaeon CG07_land_8_20_14_0_80_38_8]|nr:MAG: hypothetical protein COS83_00760 [archaeon CG07_land_8_20_14_0_80_38_8]PIU89512.1 MAG: hypothetical protein COS64_00290 [archaeon CG06_land_8_20_14_3_00_37_11]